MGFECFISRFKLIDRFEMISFSSRSKSTFVKSFLFHPLVGKIKNIKIITVIKPLFKLKSLSDKAIKEIIIVEEYRMTVVALCPNSIFKKFIVEMIS